MKELREADVEKHHVNSIKREGGIPLCQTSCRL